MTTPSVNPDDVSRIVTLTYGTMEHGGPYWCYVAVKPSRYDEFQLAMASKKYNMQNFVDDGYGEVVVSGEGVIPPTDVTKQVANLFNVPIKEFFKETNPQKVIIEKIQELGEKRPDA